MIRQFCLAIVLSGLVLSTWFFLPSVKSPSTSKAKVLSASAPEAGVVEPRVGSRAVRVVYRNPEAPAPTVANAARPVPRLPEPVAATVTSSAVNAEPTDVQATRPESPALETPVKASPENAVPTAASPRTIDINSASIEAMDHLTQAGHIGSAIARHRPYRSVKDLLTKRVIRKSVYDRIRTTVAAR